MSKIEWCDKTWNPVTGCSKISPACDNCYAERMAKRLAGRYGYPANEPFQVTYHPERIDEPDKIKKASRIFVCSMGDLFHESVRFDDQLSIWLTMERNPKHTFLLLTKRPENAKWFFGVLYRKHFQDPSLTGIHPLANIWLGVTAENQEMANKRIPVLLQIPAAKHFVSVEPMLGPVSLFSRTYSHNGTCIAEHDWLHERLKSDTGAVLQSKLDWVIAGCESGTRYRPTDIEWLRALKNQCASGRVPFFLKQLHDGEKIVKRPVLDGRTWEEFPHHRFLLGDHRSGE